MSRHSKDIYNLLENISFLVEQRKTLEPFLNYLSLYMTAQIKEEKISIEKAFEIFKFITEYYTNATILIVKAQEVITKSGIKP